MTIYLLFETGSSWSGIAVYVRLLFSLLMFYFIACFIHRVAAALSVLLIEMLLIQANHVKVSATGVPIVASDIAGLDRSLSLVSGYVTPGIQITVVALAIIVFLGWRYRRRSWREFFGNLPLGLLLPLLVGMLAFSNGMAAGMVRNGLCRIQICHVAWRPLVNVAMNGLPAQLVMTSEAVAVPERGPHSFYEERRSGLLTANQPDVLLILCESCFTTFDQRFRTPMFQFVDQGFTPFTLLSPVYGGNTAEAEFETLTGLSSAVLPGIEYQNFAERFRSDSETLVKRFADSGYATISLHNYFGGFWSRDRVYPRFGFQESIFLEDMGWESASDHRLPPDKILFDRALDRYENAAADQKMFMYLITMFTHGDYADQGGDHGRGDYLRRMNQSMGELAAFLVQMEGAAQRRKRPLAIVVFGDHKPALSRVLFDVKVFPPALFGASDLQDSSFELDWDPAPEQWKIRSQATAFVRLADPEASQALADRLDDLPMFCLPAELASLTPGNDDAFWEGVNAICHQPKDSLVRYRGDLWQQEFPLEIYAERLF